MNLFLISLFKTIIATTFCPHVLEVVPTTAASIIWGLDGIVNCRLLVDDGLQEMMTLKG